MFGYIKVDKQNMNPNEFALYHAFFCGICLSSKEQFGFKARMLTNFDIAFFNVLFHSFLKEDVEIENCHCITTPIKKRSIVKRDEITNKLSQANIILSYLNLVDDVLDEKNFKKRAALKIIQPLYKKAQKLFPELDKALTDKYNELRSLENDNCNLFDKICHPFAELSRVFAIVILGEQADEYISDLCYNLGKWVYLIDALDDLEKDFNEKSYNPLIACFGGYTNAEAFVKLNRENLEFVFYTNLNKIAENFNDLQLEKYYCILKHVLHSSIRKKTADIFEKYLKEGDINEQSI